VQQTQGAQSATAAQGATAAADDAQPCYLVCLDEGERLSRKHSGLLFISSLPGGPDVDKSREKGGDPPPILRYRTDGRGTGAEKQGALVPFGQESYGAFVP
jgi:hypothetical protein